MKRTYTASVTQRGQVTIPAEVRRELGVEPPARVLFIVENGTVRVERPAFTLETAYRSVEPPPGFDFDRDIEELTRQAKQEKAERTLRKLRDR